MLTTLVEKLYKDNKALSEYLTTQGEISFQSQVDDNFTKVLLLAAASNLEYQLTNILNGFVIKASYNCQPLISFVQKKAIIRQYHTYFDWRDGSANPFFSLFGEVLSKQIKTDRANKNLDDGIKSFMEIGVLRNTMVHEDFVSFTLNKTADEVFNLYEKSLTFISYLSDTLMKSISSK